MDFMKISSGFRFHESFDVDLLVTADFHADLMISCWESKGMSWGFFDCFLRSGVIKYGWLDTRTQWSHVQNPVRLSKGVARRTSRPRKTLVCISPSISFPCKHSLSASRKLLSPYSRDIDVIFRISNDKPQLIECIGGNQ